MYIYIYIYIYTYIYKLKQTYRLRIVTNTFISPRVILTTVRKVFRIVKDDALIEVVVRIIFSAFIITI